MAGHGHDKHHHHEPAGPITEKVIISDLLLACPQAEAVIKKHLGSDALSIPGSKTESLEFLAAMHDTHIHPVLEELNQVCKQLPGKVGHF